MNASVSRRTFLKTAAIAGGGLVLGFAVPGARRFANALEPPAEAFVPNAYLRIGADDTITVLLSHSEMGQGIWTALPMLVAEELDADWTRIKVEHAPAGDPYKHTQFGMQMTGGSTSTSTEFERYRQAGAAARTMLVQTAADRFGVAPSEVRTENGVAIAGERRARYGELADAAGKLPAPAPESIALRDPKDWKLLGKSTHRLDTPEKIDGRAKFGMDVQFEGLLTALVARAPVFGATIKSFDATKAKAVPGVRHVVQVPSGVAVVADHFWAAKLGRDALQVEWDLGPNRERLESAKLLEEFRALGKTDGAVANAAGDAKARFDGAAKKLEVEYVCRIWRTRRWNRSTAR